MILLIIIYTKIRTKRKKWGVQHKNKVKVIRADNVLYNNTCRNEIERARQERKMEETLFISLYYKWEIFISCHVFINSFSKMIKGQIRSYAAIMSVLERLSFFYEKNERSITFKTYGLEFYLQKCRMKWWMNIINVSPITTR